MVILTAAQKRTLGNILATGGTDDVTQGANRPGSIRKSVVAGLQRLGLVEAVREPNRGGWATMYYATTAGCVAFGAEIARVA